MATLNKFGVPIDGATGRGGILQPKLKYRFRVRFTGFGNLGANPIDLIIQTGIATGLGNSDTCQAIVTLFDQVNPVANCQNITVSLSATGDVTVNASAVDLSSTDNCTASSNLNFYFDAAMTVTDSVFIVSNVITVSSPRSLLFIGCQSSANLGKFSGTTLTDTDCAGEIPVIAIPPSGEPCCIARYNL